MCTEGWVHLGFFEINGGGGVVVISQCLFVLAPLLSRYESIVAQQKCVWKGGINKLQTCTFLTFPLRRSSVVSAIYSCLRLSPISFRVLNAYKMRKGLMSRSAAEGRSSSRRCRHCSITRNAAGFLIDSRGIRGMYVSSCARRRKNDTTSVL